MNEKIDLHEISAAMKHCGLAFTTDELMSMMDEAEPDQDGHMDKAADFKSGSQ